MSPRRRSWDPAAARARARAWHPAGRGRHAHRMRAVRVLPPGERRDRPGARGRGLRRDHPARAGLLRRAVAALRPGGRGGRLRPAHDRPVRAGRGGRDRGQLGRMRFGHEGVRAAAGPGRPGMGRARGRHERPGPGPGRVPGRDRAGGPAPSAAGHRRLPRRLPPGARAADHPTAARTAARDPRAEPGRGARCGHLLRFGGGVQLAAARGGQRTGRP